MIVGLLILIAIAPIVFILGGAFAVKNYYYGLDIDFQEGKISKKEKV